MTQPIIESLDAFRQWFLSPAGPGLRRIPLHQPTCHKDGITTITLYRRNGYQAELCLIPTGRHFLLTLPETDGMIVMFLGGSLTFDVVTSPNSNDHAIPSPDDYLKGMYPDGPPGDDLETPHPLMLQDNMLSTMTIQGGTKIEFHAPNKDGLLLFFSLNKPQHFYRCTTNITTIF
ncbi:hypothetical protein BG621_04840 [Parasaccharibacter apium]|nr:hypothetical protein BG621_04840 [Parasaccharibacter apium]